MTATSTTEQAALVSANAANTSSKKERKIYSGTALKLMNLMAAGCNQVEAAKACGVDESYVSQLMDEPEFKEQITEKLAQAFKDANEIDNNYQEIEKRLSKKLLGVSEFMVNPDQILRTLKFANEAKRKLAPNVQNGSNGSEGPQTNIAVLVLPSFMVKDAKRELILNPNNEVVAVDGRELTTFTSTGLNKLIENKKNAPIAPSKEVTKLKNEQKQRNVDPYSDL